MGMKTEPCPRCRGMGRDRAGDNLHRWPDGHAHCFACQHHEWPTGGSVLLQQPLNKGISLPSDATTSIDFTALTWLSKYEISMEEVVKYKMLWSPSRKFLIFPLYASEWDKDSGKLMGWQARSFITEGHKKYYNIGPFNSFFFVLNILKGMGDDIVIVEDMLSAIKVARRYTSLPLFGNNLSIERLQKLSDYCLSLTFWLDYDKVDKAMALATQATQLGFETRYIVTKYDPKEYNDTEIDEALQGAYKPLRKENS